MIYESSGIEHERVLRELRQVFDETTTEVLGRILGQMAARIEEIRVIREQSPDLQAALAELAEAQARTEVAMRRLTDQ